MDFPYHKPLSFESTAHNKLSWALFAKPLEFPSVLYVDIGVYGGALHLYVKSISDDAWLRSNNFTFLQKDFDKMDMQSRHRHNDDLFLVLSQLEDYLTGRRSEYLRRSR